jgi:hypothetical protein
MYKTCKVVMVPAQKESKEGDYIFGLYGPLLLSGIKKPMRLGKPFNEQHLYVVSNEKNLKDGTIVYCDGSSKFYPKGIYTVDGGMGADLYFLKSLDGKEDYCLRNGCEVQKVIASSDRELFVPLIDVSFIEEYCAVSGNINYVMVECTSEGKIKTKFNRIIIKPLKTSWTKEEMRDIAKHFKAVGCRDNDNIWWPYDEEEFENHIYNE